MSSSDALVAAGTDPKSRLVRAIRGWVHMDNIAETHQRQAIQARELRAKHEAEAIRLIKEMGLSASTIQVSGARLQVAQKKASAALTWSYLDREVAAWASHARLTPAQSTSLIRWLHDHREVKETEYIKKMTGVEATPPATS
jgi:hypothetical protein